MAIQDKFNKENHIYKITKDIDLEGGTLTIPANCTLDFQGGSFSNGTIVGNNTKIKANNVSIFNNINLEYNDNTSWLIDYGYAEWFENIQTALNNIRVVKLTNKTYDLTQPLIFNCGNKLIGTEKENCKLKFTIQNSNLSCIVLKKCSSINNITIEINSNNNAILYDVVNVNVDDTYYISKFCSLKKYIFIIFDIIDNCNIFRNLETFDKTAILIEAVKGYGDCGIQCKNINIHGNFNKGIELHTGQNNSSIKSGWLTDLYFDSIFIDGSKIGIYSDKIVLSDIGKTEIPPTSVHFNNVSLQARNRNTERFAYINAGRYFTFEGCFVWDWNARAVEGNKQYYINTENCIKIECISNSVEFNREYNTSNIYWDMLPYYVKNGANSNLNSIFTNIDSNTKPYPIKTLILLADGNYYCNYIMLRLLGIVKPNHNPISKGVLNVCRCGTAITFTVKSLIADNYFEYFYSTTYTEIVNNNITTIPWKKVNSSNIKITTESRPTLELNIGDQYFDTTLNRPIWWTGSKWVDANGVNVDESHIRDTETIS